MDLGRGGATLATPLKEGSFSMSLVAMEKITVRPTKFMSLIQVFFPLIFVWSFSLFTFLGFGDFAVDALNWKSSESAAAYQSVIMS